MTGTGTQTDPYIVSTWEDFKTAMSTNSSGRTYIELDADINMNEEAPAGISKITIKNITLDGKNHAIKNLVANEGFLSFAVKNGSSYISDLKILNFVNRGTSSFIILSEGAKLYFRHCTISGINTSMQHLFSVDPYYGDTRLCFTSTDDGGCMINVNIYSGGFIIGQKGSRNGKIYMTNSYIKLSSEKKTDEGAWYLDNSYIEGKFLDGYYFEDCHNSVIDAECPTNSKIYGNSCSNLLVNTDKFTGTFDNETGIKKVTTEQLVNAEYLESIGFPIGVE